MKKEVYNKLKSRLDEIEKKLNGGKGSGNFGHSGRPGEVGGSGTGNGGSHNADDIDKRITEAQKRLDDVDDLIAQEETFGDGAGDMSQLESLRQEAQDELDSLKKEKEQKESQKKDQPKQKSMLEEEIDSLESELSDLQYEIDKVEQEFEEGRRTKIDMLHTRARLRDEFSQVDLEYRTKLRKLRESEENSLEKKIENGGKGSGNFGHGGRPGKVGGSGSGDGIRVHEGSKETDYYYAEDGNRVLASGKTKEEALKKAEKKLEKEKKEGEISLKGKSLYEKVHMIEPGDEVHIKPKSNLPNFDKKIVVDYIQDGTIHYGSSERSDGYTYPAWAIDDITKIVRKKKNSALQEAYDRLDAIEKKLNGGAGSGNFGHSGRPGERGGSGKGTGKTSKSDSWDEPYKEFTKTDQLGTGDYGEAGFFTTGDFAVDSKLDAKDVVDSVKDYHVMKDMLFEAEAVDHLAKDTIGKQIESNITDLLGELHAVDAYGSATFETDERRQRIMRQTGSSVARISLALRRMQKTAKEAGYGRYVDKAIKLADKIYERAGKVETREGWETHKTARPQVDGGTLTSDRVLKGKYDEYKVKEQRRKESDRAYAFGR